MKSLLLLLALPVVALTGCSTYVGDAGPGPGYYGNGPVVYDDGYYGGGPSVNIGVGYSSYDRGGGYYHSDYHHTDNNYHSSVAANSHASYHASSTRVASANVSHASGGHTSGTSHTASASAGHDVR